MAHSTRQPHSASANTSRADVNRRARRRRTIARNLSRLALAAIVFWSIVPLYFAFVSAFKIPRDIFAWPPTLVPQEPTVRNFETLLQGWQDFPRALGNSVVITFVTVVVTVTVSLLAGYGFSNFHSPMMQKLGVASIATRMFPPIIITIPLFPILSSLGLIDRRSTLIVVYAALEVVIMTWLIKAYLDTIPKEMSEAARVDGASETKVFLKIIVPLAAPVVVATAILTGTSAWNDFQFAFLFTTVEAKTAPVVIGEMVGALTGLEWGSLFAASLVQFLPVFFFYVVVQRFLLEGITAGAVDG